VESLLDSLFNKMEHGCNEYSRLNLVFRGLGSSEVDVVPEALVEEVEPNFYHHIQGSRAQGKYGLATQSKEDHPRAGRAEQAIADGFGEASGMRLHSSEQV